MAWMLKSGSEFIIEKPQINLSGFKNLGNLFTGNTLTLYPGDGQDARTFAAKTKESIVADDPNSLKVKLEAETSWGLAQNTKVLYRGLQVGFINSTKLSPNKVELELVIYPKNRHLVKEDSRFFIVGGVSGRISSEGVEFSVPAFAQIADPAISFTSEGKDAVAESYHLFKTEIQARNAKEAERGVTEYKLVANKLPSVSQGSPVMYKNFEVGKVSNFSLMKDRIEVIVEIENRYKHLINQNTVFWNQSGIDVKAGLSGVEVNTGSLKSIVAGGIAFGDIQGIDNKDGRNWILYDSLNSAQNYGLAITFASDAANGLSEGSNIRYQGVNVGEVTGLKPDFDTDGVVVSAIIYPEYSARLAKATSYFWVAQPSLSLTKTENLDSLFGAYISVVPGKGSNAKTSRFIIQRNTPAV
ncbi:MlaD family protein [Enterovibrio coralii]|uniref:MlaD family protein n=1 Tax=Enterovibrio coralii TaxID=294935 RepID=UPI000AFDC497|nr:MlaD family protein [Enterovibrio coralii]